MRIAADAIAQLSRYSRFIASWGWGYRHSKPAWSPEWPTACIVRIVLPVSIMIRGSRRIARGRIGTIMRGCTSVFSAIKGRRWSLNTISLRWWHLARVSGWGWRMSERLDTVRIKGKIIEVWDLCAAVRSVILVAEGRAVNSPLPRI